MGWTHKNVGPVCIIHYSNGSRWAVVCFSFEDLIKLIPKKLARFRNYLYLCGIK